MIKVIAGLIINDSKIFIAKRSENKHLGGLWEFPGGKLEGLESPQECLKRELFEELRMIVKVGNFFMENKYQYSEKKILLQSFICEYISGGIELLEHTEYTWAEINKLGEYEFAPADIPIIKSLQNVKKF